jgi:hypothetical protein
MFPGVEKYFLQFYRKTERNEFYVFSLLSEKERNGTWVQHCTLHLYIAMSSLTIPSPFSVPLCSERQWWVHIYTFPVPTERSGMLLTVMGTLEFLEPFNISPFRSAPLRSAPYQNHCYVNSSNGAERSAFDNDGNIAISLAIQYFPAPLRSFCLINIGENCFLLS